MGGKLEQCKNRLSTRKSQDGFHNERNKRGLSDQFNNWRKGHMSEY